MDHTDCQGTTDQVIELLCNIDDMTGEALGYAMDLLFEEGALDVFFQPIQMKKNRPGVLFHCLCKTEERDKFIQLILAHTTTRGVRYQTMDRVKLVSSYEEIQTPYGSVQNKISSGYGITKSKLEFDDVKAIAEKTGFSLEQVYAEIQAYIKRLSR